jgi:hypothetical protein
MKVILSRKGFDSEYGGIASPILPDGTLLSLPIPYDQDIIKYTELNYQGKSYYDIINQLSRADKRISKKHTAHLDPDIRQECLSNRTKAWRPIFGQSDAALGHLNKQGVSAGDLFLFFGWFRQTEEVQDKLRFVKGSPNQHIIYGYLQIDQIITNTEPLPDYALQHPHANSFHRSKALNSIFVGMQNLSFAPSHPGAGTLSFSVKRVLTQAGQSRSRWGLPDFFKELNISYHTTNSFKSGYFQSAAKGQEFVIQPDSRLTEWAKDIVQR